MPVMNVQGHSFEISALLDKMTINDLYEIKVKTGLSMDDLQSGLDQDAIDTMSERFLVAFKVLVWIAHKRAGIAISLDEAGDIPITDITFELSPGETPKAETPKPKPAKRKASAPAGSNAATADTK